jgi:hypothetical protein
MSQETAHSLENDTLDEELTVEDIETINKLDTKIADEMKTLDNLEHPEEIKIDTGLSGADTKNFSKQIKQMSQHQIINLLSGIGKFNDPPDHKFSTMSDTSVEKNRLKCIQKINALKMKRTSKTSLSHKLDKAMTAKKESPISSTVDPVEKKLSKSQKKRLKKKNNVNEKPTETSEDT